MSKRTERNRARDVSEKATEKRREKRDSTKKENNHHDGDGDDDDATTVKSFPPPPELLASLSCAARTARYLPSRSPSLLFLFVVNSFLALNLNPFFPFSSASTHLPCSIRLPSTHGPPSTGGGGRGGGGERKQEEGCCEATVAVFTR